MRALVTGGGNERSRLREHRHVSWAFTWSYVFAHDMHALPLSGAACTLSSSERRPDRWVFTWSYVFAHAVTCTLCVCAETEAHKYPVEFLYSVTTAR